MTYKEAADRIEEHAIIHYRCEYPNALLITEALNMAVELLRQKAADSEGSSKAKWIRYLDGEHIMPDVYYKCSGCGARGFTQRFSHCPHCGIVMKG